MNNLVLNYDHLYKTLVNECLKGNGMYLNSNCIYKYRKMICAILQVAV